ncbi:uncharacterized protein [Leptinotarsa decemlineata]|uniref:uncharacterized protein n=1 Tax=Leptinotarsa decemlineata TaxID=7539 RepID=UPI003D30402F
MRGALCFLCVLFAAGKSDGTPPQLAADNAGEITQQSEKKLSETVLKILEHYKQPDPIGLPGAPIPDPMDIPDMKQSFSVGRMNFKNVKLYGLKKFRIDNVVVDITQMKVQAALTIDVLDVLGNYTLSTWLSKAHGPFTVNLKKVRVVAVASLKVEVNGMLEAQAMEMDIQFKEIAMNFEGLGFFASMFQGVMNSVGTFVFDSIKPFVLGEANTNMRSDINKELRKFPKKFPNSISPFDQLICEVRKKVISMNYDPYHVPDYNNSVGLLDIYLTHTWLYGLSSFHRTKDIIFELRNKTVHMLVQVGTGTLEGTSNWEVSLIAGMVSQVGTVSFSVNYIRVQINASQSMDTSKPPALDDIQVELGNIQIRFDGLGTIDYAVEFGVNVLPNLLRYQILDALEKPLKLKIQEALDQVNIERLIVDNADKLDNANALEDLQFL